jgi:hypothetical protein
MRTENVCENNGAVAGKGPLYRNAGEIPGSLRYYVSGVEALMFLDMFMFLYMFVCQSDMFVFLDMFHDMFHDMFVHY